MALTLNAARIDSLIAFVDRRVRREGCDHTHRFTSEWAREECVDWDDLLDIVEEHGCFCDCEVVLNLPTGDDLELRPVQAGTAENPWLLPPGFACDASAVFTKVVVCQAGLGLNTYAEEAEVLVPAPRGAKARRRVRKFVNYFIGCRSGLPTEVGIVRACAEISAQEFAHQVAGSGFEELSAFTFREAGFVLGRIAALPASTPVGTDYSERVGIASRHDELTVHRVIMK